MDAFSVSIAYGIYSKGDSKNTALKMTASFGAFQMLMPVLAGRLAKNFELDCWLRPLGCFWVPAVNWMQNDLRRVRHQAFEKAKPLTIHVILILSIVTSIDA